MMREAYPPEALRVLRCVTVDDEGEWRVDRLYVRRARRNLRPIVGGQAVSLFGDYIAFFVLPYFMLSLTGSALHLGLTAAAETLPMLLFGLAAGVFLDRRRRLGRTLIAADLIRAATFAFLAYAVTTSWMSPMVVFAAAFLVGSMAVVFDSGLQTWMTQSLDEDDLLRANTELGLARTITLSVGPLVGGLIVALAGGFAVAFGINAVTFVISAGLLALVRPRKHVPKRSYEPFGRALGSGLKVLLADKRLRWGTLGGTLTNLVFQPLEALLVLYVSSEILGLNMDDGLAQKGLYIGLFFALQAGIGSIGVAFAGKVARRLPLGTMYIIGLVLLGGGFLVVALVGSWFAVIPAGIAITGVTWVNVALVTMRQKLAPPEQMGRVIAASRTLAWAGLPIGAAMGGVIAAKVGIVPVYFGGSIGVLIVAAFLTTTALFRDPVMGTHTDERQREDDPV